MADAREDLQRIAMLVETNRERMGRGRRGTRCGFARTPRAAAREWP